MAGGYEQRTRWRTACALAGVLCVLGVMSAVPLRADAATHRIAHHHPHGLISATLVADGHGISARPDLHGIPAAPAAEPGTGTAAVVAAVANSLTARQSVDTIRTRGPPAAA